MKRTIVIGDLHGCYDEAIELLTRLDVTNEDRVIFTGDLVDRGPKPRECVELAMQHESILGNHEEKHLQQQHSQSKFISAGHRYTRERLQIKHYDYFRSLPLFLRLPEYDAAVIHAGAYPDLSLERQPNNLLLHGQCISPARLPQAPPNFKSYWPSKSPAGYSFWTNHWRGPERLIFGHTVLDQALVSPYAVGVDTGAVFGRGLTAVVLPDWKIVTIPTCSYSVRDAIAEQRLRPIAVMNGVSTFS